MECLILNFWQIEGLKWYRRAVLGCIGATLSVLEIQPLSHIDFYFLYVRLPRGDTCELMEDPDSRKVQLFQIHLGMKGWLFFTPMASHVQWRCMAEPLTTMDRLLLKVKGIFSMLAIKWRVAFKECVNFFMRKPPELRFLFLQSNGGLHCHSSYYTPLSNVKSESDINVWENDGSIYVGVFIGNSGMTIFC